MTSLTKSSYTVAIAGATGDLGFDVTQAILNNYKELFARVIVLTRSSASPAVRSLAANGATICEVDLADGLNTKERQEDLRNALKGVDVLVDVLAHYVEPAKTALFQAALDTGVKVYFPSEFGVDYRRNETIFPGFDHSIWVSKRDMLSQFRRKAVERGGRMKIVAVACGLFLNTIDAPEWRTPMIPEDTLVAWTAKGDVGRAIAELARLALDPATAGTVPDDVRIVGSHISTSSYKNEVGSVTLSNTAETSIEEAKAKLRQLNQTGKEEVTDEYIIRYIRILMAQGDLDWSSPGTNENDLVHPGERVWKWQTLGHFRKASMRNEQ